MLSFGELTNFTEFHCCKVELTFEKTVELSVIWDVMMLMFDVILTFERYWVRRENYAHAENILWLLEYICHVHGFHNFNVLGPLLLTWFNFNPSMDK